MAIFGKKPPVPAEKTAEDPRTVDEFQTRTVSAFQNAVAKGITPDTVIFVVGSILAQLIMLANRDGKDGEAYVMQKLQSAVKFILDTFEKEGIRPHKSG